MSFSEPAPHPPLTRLMLRVDALEAGLRQLRSEHNELWERVGGIAADVVHIYNLLQLDTGPHRFAFSPLERLSSVEGSIAVLSQKIEAMK